MTTERRPTFERWLELVDARVWQLAGCSAHDLPDFCYRDAYDAGYTALAVARKVVRNAEGMDE